MAAACGGETVTLRALLADLGAGDHALLTLLIGLCFMHPLPMPGISWGLAAVVVVGGWRMARGLPVWLPASLADRPIPTRIPRALFSRAAVLFGKTERLIRPRGQRLLSGAGARAAAGCAIAFCGVQLLAPLPPPTNYPPAIALLLLSLGVLESDGVFLVCGYAAALGSAALLTALLSAGWAGLRAAIAAL